MKNLVSLFYKTMIYYKAKLLVDALQNADKKNDYTKKLFIILVSSMIFLFLPVLFFCNFVVFLVTFFTITILLSLGIVVLYFKTDIFSLEKLDKQVINNSIFTCDFLNFIKNDIYFNIKFGLLTAAALFSFQLFFYTVLLIIGSLAFSRYLPALLFFFILYTVLSGVFFLWYHFIKRDSKKTFARVSKTENININRIYPVIIFVLLVVPVFFLLKIMISSVFAVLLLAVIITAGISVSLHLIFIKFNLYNKSYLIYFSGKLKTFIFNSGNFEITGKICIGFMTYKLVYPIIGLVSGILCFKLLSHFFAVDYSLKYMSFVLLLLTLFGTYPLLKQIFSSKIHFKLKRPFVFTVFIFTLVLFCFLISPFKVTVEFNEESSLYAFKDFLIPFIDRYNLWLDGFNETAAGIGSAYVVLLPLVFLAFLSISIFFNVLVHEFSRFSDYKLRKKLTKQKPSILFGDSLSLYPFLFSSTGTIIMVFILSLLLVPIAELFNGLFTTFQVTEVFKVEFLSGENIHAFFRLLFNIFIIVSLVKLVLLLVASLLSHFILFNDEIVYYENKLYKKTILRIPLSRINYIIIKQNFLERIFDIGTIYIETIDKNGMIKIKGIPAIREKNILIMDKIKSGI